MQIRPLFFTGLAFVLLAACAWPFDLSVAAYFHSLRSVPRTAFFATLSDLHDTLMTLLVVAVLYALFWWRGLRHWAALLLLAVPGGMVLNVLLKFSVRRNRPQFDDPLVMLGTYSFPSGHTVSTTLLYGVLAAWLLPQLRGLAARGAVLACAIVMVALVALSRLYLGAHYLSDVLAAVGEGCLWLTICMTVMSKPVLPWKGR